MELTKEKIEFVAENRIKEKKGKEVVFWEIGWKSFENPVDFRGQVTKEYPNGDLEVYVY